METKQSNLENMVDIPQLEKRMDSLLETVKIVLYDPIKIPQLEETITNLRKLSTEYKKLVGRAYDPNLKYIQSETKL